MKKKVWMTDSGSFDVVCPECDTMFSVHVEVASTQVDRPSEPPDKPPGVGDWWDCYLGVAKIEELYKIGVGLRIGESLCSVDRCDLRQCIRRSDAPLQKGDRGLFKNVEVWIDEDEDETEDGTIGIVFTKEDLKLDIDDEPLEWGYIVPDRFTLTEPVYPDGGKLSGKEKED